MNYFSKGHVDDHMDVTLPLARKAYGDKNQIIVAMEELSELSCAIAKFCRYNTTEEAVQMTVAKVIGEVADVMIILDTIQRIYGYPMKEVYLIMERKLNRLDGWLIKSASMTQTTIYRELDSAE